jgi:hypothetical protein
MTNKVRCGLLIALVAVLIGGGTSACSSPPSCFPEQITATPATASPGQTITVESQAASCDLGYPQGKNYQIRFYQGTSAVGEPVNISVSPDGSFSQRIQLPSALNRGPTDAEIIGSSFDTCSDGASCATYSVRVEVS